MPTQEQAKQALQKLIDTYNETDRFRPLSEADVIQKYIEPLLGDVLGWPLRDSERYLRELHTVAGRPDLRLTAENGEVIYVEAKKFGIIDKLEKYEGTRYMGDLERRQAKAERRMGGAFYPEQLALPSMAVDRTQEEQQAINYAFKLGSDWAILTSFERFRLFNARRDWLVLSFEDPADFMHDFDLLWQLSYENILNGSLNYLSNQRYREDVDKAYLELINTWRQELASDLLKETAKNPWIRVDGKFDLNLIRSVVQRIIDRLVIVRFAEDHLVIPPGTLNGFYELRRDNPYTHTMDEFIDRFFRRFDEDHNSALFAKGMVDEATFSDDVLMRLVKDLYRVKFRAMPADILGNTYEQYLGKALVVDADSISTRDNLETRKKQGSYYTPQVIVKYIVDNSLGRYLYGTENGKPDGKPIEGEKRKTSAEIRDLQVLDSACGSGSFLIYAYQVLREFYESEFTRLNEAYVQGIADLAAKVEPATIEENVAVQKFANERERIRHFSRIILETHLYGVDLDPQAAEIAVVNLMMRAMEKQSGEKRLPLILNQNVKVGNALIGLRPDDERLKEHSPALAKIRQLRLDLKATANTDPKHDEILEQLESEKAALYKVFEADFAAQFSDLERVRPFHWAIEFPEVFFDENGTAEENFGFDVIVGNPPWEIVKPDLREYYAQFDADIESRLSRAKAEARIEELEAEEPTRKAGWELQKASIEAQAAYYRATSDYQRQGRGDTATHKLFMERSYAHLLAKEGRLGYVVPSGIYTDLGTKELREMLLNEGAIQYIYSFSNERFFFAGVHHSFKFVLLGTQKGTQSDGFWATFRFNPRVAVAPDDFLEFVANQDNLVYVKTASIAKFSPDSLSVMEFKSQIAYDATQTMYSDNPLMGEEIEGNWNVKLTSELHMTNDRHHFNQRQNNIPLYEGKLIHQFNAYFAEAQNWIISEQKTSERLENKNGTGKDYLEPRLAIRAIARTTDIRTLIACVIPPNVFCGNSLLTVMGGYMNNHEKLFAQSVLNSLAIDFVLRNKIASNVNMFFLYQLPLPRLVAGNRYFDALVSRAAALTCVREEFADLWQAVMGRKWVEPSVGTNEPPPLAPPQSIGEGNWLPVVDEKGRQKLRDEIDALVAHLYGLSRDEFEHILGTFPLVFPDDATGKAKKETLLAEYDQWADKVKDWKRN